MKNEHKKYSKLISSIVILVIFAMLLSACMSASPPSPWAATGEPVPAPMPVNTRVASVIGVREVSLVLMEDGSLWSWGFGRLLGSDDSWSRNFPEQILDNVVYVTSSGGHVAALKADGTLWTCA